jgi:branched-chain amino acid transport system permease protein
MDLLRMFVQIFLNNLHTIGILALMTLGLTLTVKTANVTNFSQSIVSTFGAYGAAWIIMNVIANPWLAALAGVTLCFLTGLILDAVIIRRCSPNGSGRVMITLGLIVLFNAFLPLIFGMVPYKFTRFFQGTFDFTFMGASFSVTKNGLFVFFASAVLVSIVFAALNLTKWGLGVRATASNKNVAAMMGINTNRMTAISWALSSACGGLAAIFHSSQTTNVSVAMLGTVQANSLLALVLGGLVTFYGPVLGAVLIPIILVIVSMLSNLWAQPLMYIVALIIVLILPNGLFGKQTAKKV